MQKETSLYYKGYLIATTEVRLINDNGTNHKLVRWYLIREGKFLLSDFRTIEGYELQSRGHAINDAKKNVDAFIRLRI